MKKARKTGNLSLAAQLCGRLPPGSVDALLTRASLLSQQGKLVDGLQLLWCSSSPALQRVATMVYGSSTATGAPVSASTASGSSLHTRIETTTEMRIGLSICNLLGEGRRDPSVLAFVSSLTSPGSDSAATSGASNASTLAVDALKEKMLESLRLPSDIASRDNSDLECHLSYADAVYSRGTILTKKAESDPLAVVPSHLKESFLVMCGGDEAICNAILQSYVPQSLSMLMDEHRAHQGPALLMRELETRGLTTAGLDLSISQWASDLLLHLLTPYNRAMQTYSRWLYLSASGALNENYFDRTLRAALRLLRLLTKYGEELLMVSECLDVVPVGVWTHLIPQLISRLGHSHSFVRNHVLKLLIKIATSHPQAVIYQSLVRSGSSSEDSSKSAASGPGQSISAQYRAKPLPTTSKIGSSAKTPTSSSHSMATKLQREQLTKLKYSLLQLHPQLVSDTQLLLTEFERITTLPDERALTTVRSLQAEVRRLQKSIQDESTRLQALYPQIEMRTNMLKEKYLVVMRPTIVKLEAFAREIAAMLSTSSSAAALSGNPSAKSNPPTPSKSHMSSTNSKGDAFVEETAASSSVATSKFESLFAANVLPVLSKCLTYLRDETHFAADGQGHITALSMTHAVELLQQLSTRLFNSTRRTSFHLSSVSPRLANLTSSSIPVPGLALDSYSSSSENAITIQSMEEMVYILHTMTRPKKLRLRGSNGQAYTYLLKSHEDLQLDERIMQILSTVNHLLKRDKETRKRGEEARHYSVIPTSTRSGIIQWVTGTTPLYQLFLDHMMRIYKQQVQPTSVPQVTPSKTASTTDSSTKKPTETKFLKPTDLFFYKIQLKLSEIGLAPVPVPGVVVRPSSLPPRSQWPDKIVKLVFEEMVAETPNDVFWKAMWSWSADVESHARTVQRYNRSTATMSIVGYVLGLGDRHLDNLLLDVSTGDVIHIDYNVCFESGARLHVPEVVPFRLTPNLVTALGILGLQGTFQISAQNVLRVLSQARETLLTMLEAFVYDPLVDWRDNSSFIDTSASKANLAIATPTSTVQKDNASKPSLFPPHNAATSVSQLRVVLSLFVQRLTLHAPYLLSTAQVNALRTNITQMYSHAHLLLHSKTEHARVVAAASERATQLKALEESLATAQLNLDNAKKNLEKSKAKLKIKLGSEKEVEDALRVAVTSAQSTYLQSMANCLYQLLRPDLGSMGDATGDLYSMIVGPLPSFLQPTSMPKPLTAFSTTQQWPQLPIATLARSKELSAKLETAVKSFDSSLSRANRLLSTYRAIASQLPEGYASLLELENWLNALESTVATPSSAARESLRNLLIQRYGGSFDNFLNIVKSKKLTTSALTGQERDDFERARQLLTSLQSDVDQHTSDLTRAKAKASDTERAIGNVRITFGERVSKLVDSIMAPPGLSTINIPELALQKSVVHSLSTLKQAFEKLEQKETPIKATTSEQPSNPFLAFLAPLPAPTAASTSNASSQKHLTSNSLSASLKRAYIITKRIKTATVLCPTLLPPHTVSMPGLEPTTLSVADRAEQVLLILQSLTGSLGELCSNLNSLAHMDANQAVLEFVNSPEFGGDVQALRNFFSTRLAPSHPLVTLDRFLTLTYARFADLYCSVTGSMDLPASALHFFETEHATLFTKLTTSPSPSPLLIEYFSNLLYKIVIDLAFEAISERVSAFSFETVVPSSMSSTFISSCSQMDTNLAECMAFSDTCAQLFWQQAVESMEVEKLESLISDSQNECARIEWLVDHLVERSGSSLTLKPTHSMRRQLLTDLDQTLAELSNALSELDALAPNYEHVEESVTKLMDTRIAQAVSEAVRETKISAQASSDPSHANNLSSDLPTLAHYEEARRVFMNSCSLRRETLGVLQNLARESLSCISSVLRFEREVRGGRFESVVCGEEAAKYLSTVEMDAEVEKFDAASNRVLVLEEEVEELRDKLHVFTVQMDVDNLLTKNFDKEVGIAREQVLPATTATRKALVTHDELKIEKELDLLFTSIAHRSHSKESEAGSIEAEIHNVATQLEKVTAYLRTEIRCLTAPLANFLLNPSAPPMQIPSQPGSSTMVPFNARAADLPAGQKRLLDALKLRKRLLLELEKLAHHWLSQNPEGNVSASEAAFNPRGEDAGSQKAAENEMRSSGQTVPAAVASTSSSAATTSIAPPTSTHGPSNVINIAHAFPGAFPSTSATTAPPAATSSLVPTKTIGILKRIQQKLDNTDPVLFKTLPPSNLHPVNVASAYTQPLPRHSIEDQVAALIAEATNPHNLSNMYEGWTPWI